MAQNKTAIEPMRPHQRDEFAEIWLPWLRDTMKKTAEAEDMMIMADPAAYYRGQGGEAFLARFDEQVVGAVAIKKVGPAGFEFCKLVVTEAARGHGVGRALVERCVQFTREHAGPALFLQSFLALDVALALYRRMGFVETPAPQGMTVLARTEIIMSIAVS
jgi:GNAT superfamily N-acetyltransferase